MFITKKKTFLEGVALKGNIYYFKTLKIDFRIFIILTRIIKYQPTLCI